MHNASLCAELGYYYEGHDTQAGSRELLRAIDTHDAQADAYRERQRAAIDRFRPGNAAMTAAYTALLDGLFHNAPAPPEYVLSQASS